MELARKNIELSPIRIDDQKFSFSESKWAVERQKNVEAIADEFRMAPNMVKILSDNKLGTEPLVCLTKSRFESLLKLFRDLNNGQAFIKVNLETLMRAVTLIQSRIEEKNIRDNQLQASLGILSSISTQINSEILVSGKKKGIELSEVTTDELKGLPED